MAISIEEYNWRKANDPDFNPSLTENIPEFSSYADYMNVVTGSSASVPTVASDPSYSNYVVYDKMQSYGPATLSNKIVETPYDVYSGQDPSTGKSYMDFYNELKALFPAGGIDDPYLQGLALHGLQSGAEAGTLSPLDIEAMTQTRMEEASKAVWTPAQAEFARTQEEIVGQLQKAGKFGSSATAQELTRASEYYNLSKAAQQAEMNLGIYSQMDQLLSAEREREAQAKQQERNRVLESSLAKANIDSTTSLAIMEAAQRAYEFDITETDRNGIPKWMKELELEAAQTIVPETGRPYALLIAEQRLLEEARQFNIGTEVGDKQFKAQLDFAVDKFNMEFSFGQEVWGKEFAENIRQFDVTRADSRAELKARLEWARDELDMTLDQQWNMFGRELSQRVLEFDTTTTIGQQQFNDNIEWLKTSFSLTDSQIRDLATDQLQNNLDVINTEYGYQVNPVTGKLYTYELAANQLLWAKTSFWAKEINPDTGKPYSAEIADNILEFQKTQWGYEINPETGRLYIYDFQFADLKSTIDPETGKSYEILLNERALTAKINPATGKYYTDEEAERITSAQINPKTGKLYATELAEKELTTQINPATGKMYGLELQERSLLASINPLTGRYYTEEEAERVAGAQINPVTGKMYSIEIAEKELTAKINPATGKFYTDEEAKRMMDAQINSQTGKLYTTELEEKGLMAQVNPATGKMYGLELQEKTLIASINPLTGRYYTEEEAERVASAQINPATGKFYTVESVEKELTARINPITGKFYTDEEAKRITDAQVNPATGKFYVTELEETALTAKINPATGKYYTDEEAKRITDAQIDPETGKLWTVKLTETDLLSQINPETGKTYAAEIAMGALKLNRDVADVSERSQYIADAVTILESPAVVKFLEGKNTKEAGIFIEGLLDIVMLGINATDEEIDEIFNRMERESGETGPVKGGAVYNTTLRENVKAALQTRRG